MTENTAMTENTYTDTSRWSYHVDDAWYERVVRYHQLLTQDWPESDPAALHRVSAFLTREARLIDASRFDDWLALFSGDCLYWVPITPGGGDPRHEVSHAFDDHRRLTDRVYWLDTGLAFSQIPPSRTRRLITNIETIDDPETGATLVRSDFLLTEFRAGITKTYTGWYGHALVDDGAGGWQVRLKQVNLLDSDQLHENLTLVF